MNPKFRVPYLLLGFLGLAFLVYQVVTTFPEFKPEIVLIITVLDMLFFFLAYKTYPVEENAKNNR